jgi:alpha-amylase
MIRLLLFCLIAIFIGKASLNAQPTQQVKKTLLQVFWWDYKNNNYPNGWANYLTDLAPRLKTMGVDAVWIPPSIKNQDFGEKGVGYAPYDHYDLGDKYQKNDATTRIGTKDDLLRMIAVMHANGIEVVQDIVPNHVIGAGSDLGNGGQDPAAPAAGCTDTWKNFRYACYETPATDQTAANYFGRKGRFPKNHQNFHPNGAHGCNNDLCPTGSAEQNICWQGFGPDVCYYDGAQGQSSNATTFNPIQSTYSPNNNGGTGTGNGYMRKHTREWLIWYKKQCGFDGVRVDAVKHFPNFASEDFLWNLQNNAQWANGRDKMLAVGEWVGGATELDAWTAAVQNRAGTFDFSARGGVYGMIYGTGGYDMGNLPGTQQSIRFIDVAGVRIHRTVPFVNNHDTYRPITATNGNITGWNTGSQLASNVEPWQPRVAAAYAAVSALDGNPQIFFEDLFNIGKTGKRWTHLPTNTTDLPANQDIVNIMQAHGALNFKGGNYAVPSNVASFWNAVTSSNNNDDYLVIERAGKAIVGVTDNWTTDQEAWVDTNFPVGTVLVDYSGGIATTTTVQCPSSGCGGSGPNRVNIRTRAVGWPTFVYNENYPDPGAHYHGYSIWAPAGATLGTPNAPILTTQEWEMENDLGDSHCLSLTQGGRTPDNSPNARVVGKIFVNGGSTVTFRDSLGTPGVGQIIEFYDLNGNLLHSANGSGAVISGSFTSSTTRWIVAKIRNAAANTNGQKSWVRLSYNAPATVSTSAYPTANQVFIWTSNGGSSNWSDCRNWEEGRVPACTGTVIVPHAVKFMPSVSSCFTGTFINRATRSLSPKVFLQGGYDTGSGLMNDVLRSNNLLPLSTPYGGTETTTAGVLAVTGNNAIVDWIQIELRDKTNPATVLQSRSALLQRDGDVVNMDGTSPVWFDRMLTNDTCFVVLRHRNHLGFRTSGPVPLADAVFQPDYTTNISGVFGSNPLSTVAAGVFGMYAGDANGDGFINATDRNAHWQPQSTLPYNYLTSKADFNLDGAVNTVDRNSFWRVNNSRLEQW